MFKIHPASCCSFLLLLLSLAAAPPSTFAQFEIIPDEDADKKAAEVTPGLDAFGASPDEFTNETENSESGAFTPSKKSAGADDASKTASKKTSDALGTIKSTKPATSAATEPSVVRNGKTKKTAPNISRNTSNRTTASSKPFEEQFWQYLKANNYSNWAPVPGTSGGLYPGSGPHGALLKMYMNRTAVGNVEDLPEGSVIVKENYGEDQTLLAITVMYRAKGYNVKSGNWYWVKYNPDGTVARTSTEAGFKKIRGSVKSCIDCHTDAGGGDFVFFNDQK